VTFTEEYGSECQWLYESTSTGGSEVFVSFSELRSSPDWQAFTEPSLVAGPTPVPFTGFDSQGLIDFLDAQVSNALRNPATGAGDDAELVAPTTTTRIDPSTLQVTEHVGGLGPLNVAPASADVTYDLVIGTGTACPSQTGSCVLVENASVDSSFGSLGAILVPVFFDELPGAIDTMFAAFVDQTRPISLPSFAGVSYCFTGPGTSALGLYETGVQFDDDSLTVCAP
jgi:hypothetical protein